MDTQVRKSSFTLEDLLECARGKMFGPGNAQLPLPPMLMFDRITRINEDGGAEGKGEIEAEFDDAERAGLLAGYSADVEVVLDRRDSTLRVPTSVILPDKSVYVFDPASRQLALRAIETGIANWEYTEIVSGLSEGDRVVSSIDREGVHDGAAAIPE